MHIIWTVEMKVWIILEAIIISTIFGIVLIGFMLKALYLSSNKRI